MTKPGWFAIMIIDLGYAGVAQLVEQLICNQQVGGSNPSTSSTEKPCNHYDCRALSYLKLTLRRNGFLPIAAAKSRSEYVIHRAERAKGWNVFFVCSMDVSLDHFKRSMP